MMTRYTTSSVQEVGGVSWSAAVSSALLARLFNSFGESITSPRFIAVVRLNKAASSRAIQENNRRRQCWWCGELRSHGGGHRLLGKSKARLCCFVVVPRLRLMKTP
jgi:hypothetical protein